MKTELSRIELMKFKNWMQDMILKVDDECLIESLEQSIVEANQLDFSDWPGHDVYESWLVFKAQTEGF